MQPTTENAWHVTRGGQTYGPYTWEQIAEHARGGRIGSKDKIFDPRSGAWTKPTQVPGLFGAGGVATTPVGVVSAAKVAVGIVLGLAIALGVLVSLDVLNFSVLPGRLASDFTQGAAIVQQNSKPVVSQTAQMPPEGYTFKGTFNWESKEGEKHSDPCFLWIYTTDDGTAADFDFGTVDGWPLFLVSQSGSQYRFEMSKRSLVGRVKMNVTVGEAGATGRIDNIDWHADTFSHGTFTGTAIPYDQYKAEAQ